MPVLHLLTIAGVILLLLPSGVAAQDAAALAGAYEPDANTLLLYHFDGDGDEILDASSHELHGHPNRGPLGRGEGLFGSSLRLTQGQFVQIDGDPECLRAMNQVTAELWFKTTSASQKRLQRLLVHSQHYAIAVFESRFLRGYLYDRKAKVLRLTSKTPVAPSVWYHVALTFDGDRGALWVNGRQEASGRLGGPLNDAPGSPTVSMNEANGGTDDVGGLTAGYIDELRISDVARTRFPAARERKFCNLICDRAVSPGTLRIGLHPTVPATAESVSCTAVLRECGAEDTVVMDADQLRRVEGEPLQTGEAHVVLPVPEGMEGRASVLCTAAWTADGGGASVSQQLPVGIEPMIPPPASEFRAAWTHSHRAENPDDLFSRMAAGGLNAAIMRVRRGETAYYASKVGPLSIVPFGNPNQLDDCLAAAEKHGVDLHVYVNCFNIGQPTSDFAQQLRRDGRWQKAWDGRNMAWLCPADPANVEIVKQGMLELVREYAVKGIQYDYIRYPERKACYCKRCRAAFEKRIGKRVENWPEDARPQGPLAEEYLDARAEHVTDAVRQITAAIRKVRPDVLISAAVFAQGPEAARRSVGQDWLRWCEEGLVDAICPMSYVYDPPAFEQTVVNILAAVDGAVPVYAGIGVRSSGGKIHYPEELAAKLNILRRLGAPGFTIFAISQPTDVPETVLIPLRGTVLAGDGRE